MYRKFNYMQKQVGKEVNYDVFLMFNSKICHCQSPQK
jgi:hypothetical protein